MATVLGFQFEPRKTNKSKRVLDNYDASSSDGEDGDETSLIRGL